jgi:hypothetical protein
MAIYLRRKKRRRSKQPRPDYPFQETRAEKEEFISLQFDPDKRYIIIGVDPGFANENPMSLVAIDGRGVALGTRRFFAGQYVPGQEYQRAWNFIVKAGDMLDELLDEIYGGHDFDKDFDKDFEKNLPVFGYGVEYPLGTHKGAGSTIHEAFMAAVGISQRLQGFYRCQICTAVSPYDLKRYMTGRAKATKDEVMAVCSREYYFAHMNSDGLADAFSVAQFTRWLYAYQLSQGDTC